MTTTPRTATVPALYQDMLKQPHLLIAGATGSGKSVVINGMIYTLLQRGPDFGRLILIDPKRVELWQYRTLPHAWLYADTVPGFHFVLDSAIKELEYRLNLMRSRGVRDYPGTDHLYIFIDEYADLKLTGGPALERKVQRIAQLGRAAGVHLICATQRCTREILTGAVKVNIDSRLALRVPTKQDSRNVIEVAGAEQLPRYGQGFYLTPDTLQPVRVLVPMISQEEINQVINYYL